jgi:outer membrane receptor protein involved in Fe transport
MSMRKHGSRFALSLLAVALSQAVYAADDPQAMEEVVVSGSRVATKLSETPVAIGVVNTHALKRDKPKTMGDVINRIAGVSWNDLGNEQHSMGIRQPNSTQAVYQYLEDGVPIRPLGVFNHNSLNEMNLSGTERVEVIKGAASSLYGSNAIGGAVNFMTARPSLSPYASIGARHDNISGFDRVDTGASNTWGDFGLRFSHYGSRRSRDNWQQYSNGTKDSITLRGDYALGGSSLIHAVLTHNNLDSATPGSLNPADYQATPGKSYQTFSWRKDKTTRFTAVWEGETLRNGMTTATLFGRQNDHGQLPNYTISACTIGPTCATGYRGTINNNGVKSLGLDVKHQQEFTWLSSRLIAGVYYDQSPNAYKSDNLDVTRNVVTKVYTGQVISTTYLTGNRNYQTDIKNTALFAQYELSLLDKLRVVIGGRGDDIQYGFTNNLTPSANFGAPNETRNFSHFSPKIGATYAVSNQASVYANISEGFRPPEVSELYGKTAIPDLNPSTYSNLELGLRMAFMDGALKLDSAIYRLDGHDTIVSYTSAVGSSFNKNAGRTRSQGLEVNLNWDSSTTFDARLGASFASHRYVQYRVKDSAPIEDYSGKEMPSAPDSATAEIGYKPLENARVALQLVRQGGYWMNNLNTVRYPGHTLFNLNGSYKLAGGWEAWLQGRNLTDQLYSDSASSSYKSGIYTPNNTDTYSTGAPRSIMIGLNYTFDGKK